MTSVSERSARWRAKTMIFCLNAQFCLWLLPLTELFTGKILIGNTSYFIVVSIFILSVCFILKYRYVDRAVAKLDETEARLKYKGIFIYGFVIVIYLISFIGFGFLVAHARKARGL